MGGIEHLGTIDGREVAVRIIRGDPMMCGGKGQEILIERGPVTDRLAMLLAFYQGLYLWHGDDGRLFCVVEYTEDVDRLLVELIDVLIGIRYAHPTMVQLKLVLDEKEAEELLEALGG